MEKQEIRLPFYARLALVLLSVVLILFLMHAARTIIIPLFFSLLIAFMVLPLSQRFERVLPRGVSAVLSIFIFIVLVAGLFFFLAQQIGEFSKDLPQLGSRLQHWTRDLQSWVSKRFHVNYSRQLEYLNTVGEGLANYATALAQNFFLALSGFIIWTIFVFIFTFFILTHRSLLKRFIVCLFDTRYHNHVNEVMLETKLLANGYVVGLLIEMVIVAAINCAALLILGVKYALLLGIIAAVLNIIPYIGIYTATGIAALITLSNSTPGAALWVIVLLLVVHFVDANILMPRIVGSRVKMNPLITIIAVLAGSLLWGISGTFLFIPLAAMLKIIFERVDGLKPWAVLMGSTEEDPKPKQVKKKSGQPPLPSPQAD